MSDFLSWLRRPPLARSGPAGGAGTPRFGRRAPGGPRSEGGDHGSAPSGFSIAFVGADASGKSTLVAEADHWLGARYPVKVVHAGKPPSCWLTWPFNVVYRAARRLMPPTINRRRVERETACVRRSFSQSCLLMLNAVRAVTLAVDRNRLSMRVKRLARRGTVVVCDRYPCRGAGIVDGPRLSIDGCPPGLLGLLYWRLARWERRLYRSIPPPDFVVRVSVSFDVALRRNALRPEPDEETYLRERHRRAGEWRFPGVKETFEISADSGLDRTVQLVRAVLGKACKLITQAEAPA